MKKHFVIPQAPSPSSAPSFSKDQPWLAPLAGYSDLPFRLLCREYGAATCVTEMISAKGLLYRSPGTADLLNSIPQDQPLVVQLFGSEPEDLASATSMLAQAGYRWLDLNLGCPVKKVMRQHSGSDLLSDPERVLKIASAMISTLHSYDKKNCGIGFKLRLGVDLNHPCLPDLALRLEDAGAAWLTLHPRYASEGFGGKAKWPAIADLAARIDIPLIASGDLFTAEDGLRCLQETNATTVMYGRGALRNPAIFADHIALSHNMPAPVFSAEALSRQILRHVALAREFCDRKQAFFKMRSIIPRYVRFFPGVNELRKALCECSEWDQLSAILDKFLSENKDKAHATLHQKDD